MAQENNFVLSEARLKKIQSYILNGSIPKTLTVSEINQLFDEISNLPLITKMEVTPAESPKVEAPKAEAPKAEEIKS